MFELFYPGNCFGNIDVSAKECKKCKIKQFCVPTSGLTKEELGLSHFRGMVFEKYVCEVETTEGKTEVRCFEKDATIPCMTIEFSDNGKVTVNKGEIHETVNHIVSKEKAESLFKKITEPPCSVQPDVS